jgi:integrase
LRERESIGAAALEFLILTASRTNEALGAQWSEIDLAEKLWTVPAQRMKGARPHRVPLWARAVEIIEGLAKNKVGAFVFPGRRSAMAPSNMALEMSCAE